MYARMSAEREQFHWITRCSNRAEQSGFGGKKTLIYATATLIVSSNIQRMTQIDDIDKD